MIWLIGNKGMLGSELAQVLAASGLEFAGSDREVNILDPEAIAGFTVGKKIEWIVNCAAYTAVEKAEDEVELCSRLNIDGPENIARAALALRRTAHSNIDRLRVRRLKHQALPRRRSRSAYRRVRSHQGRGRGSSSRRLPRPHHPAHGLAVRHARAQFVNTMLKLMRERDKIGVVADQRGTPTYAADLASAILSILRSPQPVYGTFHFTDLGETTWHEFAVAIRRLGREHGLLPHDCAIDPLTTAQYPTKVRRPAYSVLSKEKIVEAYGLKIPKWEESLQIYIGERQPS